MKKILILIVMLFLSMPIFSENYRVLYISDGDTIAVKKTENGKATGKLIKVRLFGIDAPELKQDYGYESKQALMNFIKNKDVKIEGKKKTDTED